MYRANRSHSHRAMQRGACQRHCRTAAAGKRAHQKHLSELTFLVQLKTLSLANNEISAIENVQQLTTLEKLNLSRNRLTSLEGLAVLHALAEVDASFNGLHSVQAQHLPPRLRVLNVGGNCIQQLSHLESLARASSLTSLRIAGMHSCGHVMLSRSQYLPCLLRA
jgi:hypothetical protein